MCKNYAKLGHIGLPGNRRQNKKNQRALWCYNARAVTNHIADFAPLILFTLLGLLIYGITFVRLLLPTALSPSKHTSIRFISNLLPLLTILTYLVRTHWSRLNNFFHTVVLLSTILIYYTSCFPSQSYFLLYINVLFCLYCPVILINGEHHALDLVSFVLVQLWHLFRHCYFCVSLH